MVPGRFRPVWGRFLRVSGRFVLRRAEIQREPLRGHLGTHEAGQQVLQPLDAGDDVDDLFVAAEELLVVLLQDFGLEPCQLGQAGAQLGLAEFALAGGPLGVEVQDACIPAG